MSPTSPGAARLRWSQSALLAYLASPLGLGPISPFRRSGPVHHATLRFDRGARLPGHNSLLEAGAEFSALVRFSRLPLPLGQPDVLTLCLKLPDAHGPGRDQDFLLATSGDGAPMHHLLLPASAVGERLYSSLWLYAVGVRPVLFGVLADELVASSAGPAAGDRLRFAVAGPVGRFRGVADLVLAGPLDLTEAAAIAFAATNTGGGLRPLPPTAFYRERG